MAESDTKIKTERQVHGHLHNLLGRVLPLVAGCPEDFRDYNLHGR